MKKKKKDIFFEEALAEEWKDDINFFEVELSSGPLFYAGFLILILSLVVLGRIIFLNVVLGKNFQEQAQINSGQKEFILPPRGLIYDRNGKILAQNQIAFSAFLNIENFIKNEDLQQKTLEIIEKNFGISKSDFENLIKERLSSNILTPILISSDLTHEQILFLQRENLPTIQIKESFKRFYPYGEYFSTFLGYVGYPDLLDLKQKNYLKPQFLTGKTGIEAYYDKELVGEPGIILNIRDAKGKILSTTKAQDVKPGKDLNLTIDAELQEYLYKRIKEGLEFLGRESGAGLILNPQNGEVLAMVSFPSFDNNIFLQPQKKEEIQKILNDANKPLFNRVISGIYAPGSTIKPLVGVAGLKEGVITPEKKIFSPGYLDIPNPYDPLKPTRFLDWRYQGEVNLYSAIAQSSNVYFYIVGGGFGDISGLGISRLIEWWKKFGLGQKTNIDLIGESTGFLPTPQWHKKVFGREWLIGDTYNVSIGQGDLGVTPLQLLNYISAIGNGGKIYKPHLLKDLQPEVLIDLSYLKPEIEEVKKGMVETITSPLGTAHLMVDLPFEITGKTGSAQIEGNKYENAFFVGFAPKDNPQIAILILVEKARQGSLNAVPIAKDVLNWYYENRMKNK
jgi:penicillin-binding protein 2